VISLDTETTGVDFYHGARPFFVTMCTGEGEQYYFEWDVDPLTRQPQIPDEDVREIAELLFASGPSGPIGDYEQDSGGLILQNAKFDFTALRFIGLWDQGFDVYECWKAVKDTLIAGHLLASNQPHNLTDMALHYLGTDIEPHEEKLKEATKEARRMVQQAKLKVKRAAAKGTEGALFEDDNPLAQWRIASDDLPDIPSAGAEPWKYDTWLPRALVKHLWETSDARLAWMNLPQKQPRGVDFGRLLKIDRVSELPGWQYRPPEIMEGDHPWWTVLRDYANADSAVTVSLWPVMLRHIKQRNLEAIFRERMKVIPVAYRMEETGVTVSAANLDELEARYRQESIEAGECCVQTAADMGYELELPKGASPNNSLRQFMFEGLKLPQMRNPKGKTSAPTLNKAVMEHYLSSLPEGPGLDFVRSLTGKRKKDTALAYMAGYRKFWIPLGIFDDTGRQLWYCLHPNLNPTGTDTLRWSSNNPNEQNISKQEIECPTCRGEGCKECKGSGLQLRSLRYCFGPAPDREWWSCDARNIELRIPAYAAEEVEMIGLFERPDEPPYYGSNHLLNFHTVYPDIWDKSLKEGVWEWEGKHKGKKIDLSLVGPYVKKKYADTWYQWCKNGGFAVLYGAVDRAEGGGTADRAFHRNGSHARLRERFNRLEQLNQKCIRFANKHGYIETMPDKTVDPARGYPLMCSRSDRGDVKPTIPLNYFSQGTAMWWMMKAMIRCQNLLDSWRASSGFDGRIVMQVHDELVFDFPKSRIHPREDLDPSRPDGVKLMRRSNLWRIRKIQSVMSLGGDDLGLPTPVSCEYHTHNWGEGESI